jgi:hypothetical protein
VDGSCLFLKKTFAWQEVELNISKVQRCLSFLCEVRRSFDALLRVLRLAWLALILQTMTDFPLELRKVVVALNAGLGGSAR